MAQRVVEQVGQHPLDQPQVSAGRRHVGGEGGFQFDLARLGGQFEFLENILGQVGQGEALQHRLHEAVFQPHQFQQRLRQAADLAALIQGDAQVATTLFG
ncbi:hypothetical protein D3C76_1565450 [compost metagenome]